MVEAIHEFKTLDELIHYTSTYYKNIILPNKPFNMIIEYDIHVVEFILKSNPKLSKYDIDIIQAIRVAQNHIEHAKWRKIAINILEIYKNRKVK